MRRRRWLRAAHARASRRSSAICYRLGHQACTPRCCALNCARLSRRGSLLHISRRARRRAAARLRRLRRSVLRAL
jgi:hypothetical protein